MKIESFQTHSSDTDFTAQLAPRAEDLLLLGSVGELGSILTEAKKSIRDEDLYTGLRENLSEELGDLLWYVSRLAITRRFELSHPLPSVDTTGAPLEELLVDLSVATVSLVDAYRRTEDAQILYQSVVNSIQLVCLSQGLELENVLENNNRKNREHWCGSESTPAPYYDTTFPEHERLPRQFSITFTEIDRGARTEVLLRSKGIVIGDRLTDNAIDEDGYRFHDAFHFAFAGILGWSPVVRAMFRAKRKSCAQVDEVQDGARAQIIEEAVASLIFNYARERSWLAGKDRIGQGIIKHIQQMVRDLEVSNSKSWEWQQAILQGFSCFRKLVSQRAGVLEVDAENRTAVVNTS